MKPTCLFLSAVALLTVLAPAQSELRSQTHLADLKKGFPSAGWEAVVVSNSQLVLQAPGQPYDLRLQPVWVANLGSRQKNQGYLMWENTEEGALLEFCIEQCTPPAAAAGALVSGVPGLQQFPVRGQKGANVASGCVPTAGGSLIGFWVSHGLPTWSGADRGTTDSLERYTQRLRSRMSVMEIPDTVGYTNDGMPLSGAHPQDLARALEKDAADHGLKVATSIQRFSLETLKREIAAHRPVLLSCLVRLPHKPHLSWGHEVVGVGWFEMQGHAFVGIRDNFFPTEDSETTRWIRQESFESIITVREERMR